MKFLMSLDLNDVKMTTIAKLKDTFVHFRFIAVEHDRGLAGEHDHGHGREAIASNLHRVLSGIQVIVGAEYDRTCLLSRWTRTCSALIHWCIGIHLRD